MNSGNKKKGIQNQPHAKQGTKSDFIGPLDKWFSKNHFSKDLVANHDPKRFEAPSNDKDDQTLEEESKRQVAMMQKEAEARRSKMLEIQSPTVSTLLTMKKILMMDQLITDEERLEMTRKSELARQALVLQISLTESDVIPEKNYNQSQNNTLNHSLIGPGPANEKSPLKALISFEPRINLIEPIITESKKLDHFATEAVEVSKALIKGPYERMHLKSSGYDQEDRENLNSFGQRTPNNMSIHSRDLSKNLSTSETPSFKDKVQARQEIPPDTAPPKTSIRRDFTPFLDHLAPGVTKKLTSNYSEKKTLSVKLNPKTLKNSTIIHQKPREGSFENITAQERNRRDDSDICRKKLKTTEFEFEEEKKFIQKSRNRVDNYQNEDDDRNPSAMKVRESPKKLFPTPFSHVDVDGMNEAEHPLPVQKSNTVQLKERLEIQDICYEKNDGDEPEEKRICNEKEIFFTDDDENYCGETSINEIKRQSYAKESQPEDNSRGFNKAVKIPTKIVTSQNAPPPRMIIFNSGDANDGAEGDSAFFHRPLNGKLRQEGRDDIAESEKFRPFKLPSSVDKMDLSYYLDLLTKYVKEHKIYFTTDVEAEEYFEKCDRRYHWGFGLEWIRILNVLRGINTQKMVKDKETALLEFLIVRDERTGGLLLDLARATDYCKFSQHLKNRHTDDFHCLLSFLKANDSLIAYMRMIIRAPYGYFPDRGATQNLVLWLCGKTQCGKTSLAAIITSFLVVCKMRATNEKFMNTCGDNNIRNKPLSFNIFQLEELKKSGKGAADLMDLMDAGVSVIKGKEASGWGSDAKGDAYHFPILITSNYYPCEFFSSKTSDDRLFQEAALSRIICIEVTRTTLPDLSRTNRFGVPRLELAQFVWAFIYHSEIETDVGESYPKVIRRYEEPNSVELTIQDLSIRTGKKVHIMRATSASPRLASVHPNNEQHLQDQDQAHVLLDVNHKQLDLAKQKREIQMINTNNDDSLSIISIQTTTTSISSTAGYFSPTVKQFLHYTALKLRHSGGKGTVKARELHENFVGFCFERQQQVTPPTEQVFGKLLATIRGIYKFRRSDGQFYQLDLPYWCTSST